MKDNTRFIVTDHPPWYYKSAHKNVFECGSALGLFKEVVDLMLCKEGELSDREKGYTPKNVYKTIRDKVIRDADTIPQKPSRSLLLALMDLVDIEGGNGFESMAGVDRAGVKHVLLAFSNYTTFFVPNKDLMNANGKKVIPVVTQYTEKQDLVFHDSKRSMIATYNVGLRAMDKSGSGKSHFVQEVLFVPGFESLELLKQVTQNKFEFWDMALEVPTHKKALTPSFQQIKPFQLLVCTDDKTLSSAQCNDALTSRMEDLQPMCCVLGPTPADKLKKKRDISVDCFTEQEVRCNLECFTYQHGGARTVYFRRNGRLVDGNRVNLVPVVALRKSQAEARRLYVSTTLRFYRAVKQCCVKGNGELVSCWKDSLKDFDRGTFITGPEMYQEIYNPALTAFIKRVNPNSWCNYLPKHVESIIVDPTMAEMVELAIRFMDNKIPNAFAVAELLFCPLDKVRDYQKVWNMYLSDPMIHTSVRKKRLSVVEEEMRKDWKALTDIISKYGKKKHGEKGNDMVRECEKLCKQQTLDNVNKVYKMWFAIIRHDTDKDKTKSKDRPKDKELVQMYGNAKVIFLKLRTYHNKVKKGLRLGEGEGECDPVSSSRRQSTSSWSSAASSLSHSEVNTGTSSRRLTIEEQYIDKKAVTSVCDNGDRPFSIVTPDPVPASTWIKNMPTLLLSEPWLNDDNNLRRDAVCTLLRLDNTLLHNKYSDSLREWVIANRTVVEIIKTYGLEDRLSKALVDCLENMSTLSWKRKVELSFGGNQEEPRGHHQQQRPQSQQITKDLVVRLKRCVDSADNQACHQKSASASKSSMSKSDKKARKSQQGECDTVQAKYNREDVNIWLSKTEEVNSEEEGLDEDDEAEEVNSEEEGLDEHEAEEVNSEEEGLDEDDEAEEAYSDSECLEEREAEEANSEEECLEEHETEEVNSEEECLEEHETEEVNSDSECLEEREAEKANSDSECLEEHEAEEVNSDSECLDYHPSEALSLTLKYDNSEPLDDYDYDDGFIDDRSIDNQYTGDEEEEAFRMRKSRTKKGKCKTKKRGHKNVSYCDEDENNLEPVRKKPRAHRRIPETDSEEEEEKEEDVGGGDDVDELMMPNVKPVKRTKKYRLDKQSKARRIRSGDNVKERSVESFVEEDHSPYKRRHNKSDDERRVEPETWPSSPATRPSSPTTKRKSVKLSDTESHNDCQGGEETHKQKGIKKKREKRLNTFNKKVTHSPIDSDTKKEEEEEERRACETRRYKSDTHKQQLQKTEIGSRLYQESLLEYPTNNSNLKVTTSSSHKTPVSHSQVRLGGKKALKSPTKATWHSDTRKQESPHTDKLDRKDYTTHSAEPSFGGSDLESDFGDDGPQNISQPVSPGSSIYDTDSETFTM